MGLRKIKTPVEYSFTIWMNNFPDSAHWADKERFFQFVKTVCRYPKAKEWKNIVFLKTKILDRCPHFDPAVLENRLKSFSELVEFFGVSPISGGYEIVTDRIVKDGHYIEVECRNGKISRKEVPLKKRNIVPLKAT
jgi:hypothetical protein